MHMFLGCLLTCLYWSCLCKLAVLIFSAAIAENRRMAEVDVEMQQRQQAATIAETGSGAVARHGKNMRAVFASVRMLYKRGKSRM